MSKLEEVREFAKAAHAGQLYDGKDYYGTHVLEVALRVASDPSSNKRHVMAALLHDVVEDNPNIYMEDIQDLLGVDYGEVACAVFYLTKAANEDYTHYMTQLAKNPIAALVKYHDSAANYAYGQRPKYKKNMEFLLPYLPEASVEYLKNSS